MGLHYPSRSSGEFRSMASTSTDCPGSWRPVPEAEPGDPIRCEVCGRQVHASVPPLLEEALNPWAGSPVARVRPHWYPIRHLGLS